MSFSGVLLVIVVILCIIINLSKIECKSIKNEIFETPKSLRMVSMIFRHGHRSPVATYPNDPHMNYPWHGGFGALSRRGVKNMYDFGKTLRTRYGGLIKDHGYYNTEVMQFNSSDYERCLLSASSLIAGLLPSPIMDDENNLPFPWQPVPIHTIPLNLDATIALHAECSRYNRELTQTLKNRLSTITDEDKNLIELVGRNSGDDVINPFDVFLIQNTLEIQKLENLKLPVWTENGVFEQMTELVNEAFVIFTNTSFMKKIKGGPLITTIHDNMINYRDGKEKRILFLYSGHDITVASVENALNILNQTTTIPDFGATLIFELHENPILEDDFEVKIFYYFSNLEKVPIDISIPNCPAPCSLKRFSTSVENVIVRDYQALCY